MENKKSIEKIYILYKSKWKYDNESKVHFFIMQNCRL